MEPGSEPTRVSRCPRTRSSRCLRARVVSGSRVPRWAERARVRRTRVRGHDSDRGMRGFERRSARAASFALRALMTDSWRTFTSMVPTPTERSAAKTRRRRRRFRSGTCVVRGARWSWERGDPGGFYDAVTETCGMRRSGGWAMMQTQTQTQTQHRQARCRRQESANPRCAARRDGISFGGRDGLRRVGAILHYRGLGTRHDDDGAAPPKPFLRQGRTCKTRAARLSRDRPQSARVPYLYRRTVPEQSQHPRVMAAPGRSVGTPKDAQTASGLEMQCSSQRSLGVAGEYYCSRSCGASVRVLGLGNGTRSSEAGWPGMATARPCRPLGA
ncbi:hypothetical protein C2E23DRAFT_602318 [Lenzites betulinus]|nr:hypothetical protein C2E23DRAFT_602318 [Lenzites betulinus]